MNRYKQLTDPAQPNLVNEKGDALSICENCGHDYGCHTLFLVKNHPCITCGCSAFKFNGKQYDMTPRAK